MSTALKSFADFPALCDALAARVMSAMAIAIAARGTASLVVPGGSTPGAFFDVLCKREIAWDKVTITMTDERWVPPASEGSNEHLLRTRLLVGRAAAATFVPLKTESPTAHAAEAEVSARVESIARPFDFVIAGMGDDGHTASWIPDSQGLDAALDRRNRKFAVGIVPPDATNLGERITLTRRALLEARAVAILIRGVSKQQTLEAANSGDNVQAMPVRAFLNQDKVPVEIYWSKA
jgi:6-phosphogluconolactonase